MMKNFQFDAFSLFISAMMVVALLVALLVTPDLVLAQDPPPPAFGPGPSQTPVDGGLLALGVAGAGYAVKKFRDRTLDRKKTP